MKDILMTDYFGIDYLTFEEKGIFDALLDHDSNFFVNILRLKEAKTPEFSESYKRINDYYRKIIMLLDNADSNSNDDICFRNASSLFKFSEVNSINLGYSESSTGSGFGTSLSKQVLNNAYHIVKKGCKEPELFHLLQLFEEGIGPDRLSDMIATIILPDIKAYTLRVMKELGINSSKYPNETFDEEGFVKNKFRNFPIYFLPTEILHKLPVARCWEDVDYAVSQNITIRREINDVIGNEWNEWSTSKRKEYLRENVFMNLEAFNRVVDEYKNSNLLAYNLSDDDYYNTVKLWQSIKNQFKYFLKPFSNSCVSSFDGALQTVNIFKDWVEHNKGWDIVNKESEKTIQRLMHLASKKYLEENNLDLSCEPNEGPGPADFKISRGNDKTIIEVKLSSNSDYLHGYNEQIQHYAKADKTENMIYVYIDVGNPVRTKRLLDEYEKNKSHGYLMPVVCIIDANNQNSASIR